MAVLWFGVGVLVGVGAAAAWVIWYFRDVMH